MTRRTVEVELRLDAEQYIRQGREAAAVTQLLARRVERLEDHLDRIPPSAAQASAALRLLAENARRAEHDMRGLRDRTEDTERDLRRTPPAAASVARALRLLGVEGEGAGARLRWVGGGGDSLRVLDTHLASTREQVRRLGEEFNRTGNMDVFRRLGESEANLRSLELLRRRITGAIGDGVQDGVQDGVRTTASSPQLRAVAALLGAGIAVPLLAAIGGALTGLAGFGVAGVGIAGAILGDPQRFKQEWSVVANAVAAEFIGATAVFTGPTLDAIRSIGPMIESWDLNELFADAAKYVDPLVRGVEGFATGIVRGVSAMVDKGEPAVQALSAGLAELGNAADDAFTSIADGAEGGGEALRDVLFFTADVIRAFGAITEAAEDMYSFIHDHPVQAAVMSMGLSLPITLLDQFSDEADEAHGSINHFGGAARAAAVDFEALSKALNGTEITADSLAGKMVGKIFAATMGLDQATLQWHRSLAAVSESLKDNGRNLDINSEKGQNNRERILAAVTANMQVYQAQLAAGMSAADAAANYDSNTAALERQLRKAGLTAAQIDGLIGKYKGVPAEVNTTIALNGLESAIRQLNETIRLINGIKDKTVTITVKQAGDNPMGQSRGGNWATGGIRRAAVGMILPPSDPGTVLAAEPQTGGEALIPLRGITQARAMQLSQVAGNSYGFDVVPRDYRGYRTLAPSAGTSAAAAAAYTAGTAATAARGSAAADPRAQARVIAMALDGMAVVMDGHLVGRLQGRQADLLRRGG